MNELRDKLVAIGYFPSLNPSSRQGYIFLASRQEETGEGDIHIHLAVANTETHDNFLIIRDYLRSHNDEADQYSKIKYQYAKQANYDRSAYKNLKQLMSISYCNVPGSGKMAANLLIHIPYDTSIRNLQNNVS